MYYTIRHITRFAYSSPITESLMEVRMQPRQDAGQRLLKFDLVTQPRARIQAYRDYLGNVVHHFDIPGKHAQLKLTAEATVEALPMPVLPASLRSDAWEMLAQMADSAEHWDYLRPSQYVQPTPALNVLAHEWEVERDEDPLHLMQRINEAIRHQFDYAPNTTTVNSVIDDALTQRRGVCQDFAHIMLALARRAGIPARYVSGYLYHASSDSSAADATHAWIEAWLPELGWVGFDPTNNLFAGERHIRTAIGRDYADVPPTRGVFKGNASSELSVGVQVATAEAPLVDGELMPVSTWVATARVMEDDYAQQQQQQ